MSVYAGFCMIEMCCLGAIVIKFHPRDIQKRFVFIKCDFSGLSIFVASVFCGRDLRAIEINENIYTIWHKQSLFWASERFFRPARANWGLGCTSKYIFSYETN